MEDEKVPGEYRWGISYLREDLRDLRTDLRSSVQEVRVEVRENTKRIENLSERMDQRFDDMEEKLTGRISDVDGSLRGQIESLRKEMNTKFLWMMTTTLAIGGLIVAVIKI